MGRQALTEPAQHGAFARMMELIQQRQQRLDDLTHRVEIAERQLLEQIAAAGKKFPPPCAITICAWFFPACESNSRVEPPLWSPSCAMSCCSIVCAANVSRLHWNRSLPWPFWNANN